MAFRRKISITLIFAAGTLAFVADVPVRHCVSFSIFPPAYAEDVDTKGTESEKARSLLFASGGWCADFRHGAYKKGDTGSSRKNRKRLEAAQAYLSPGFDPKKSVTGLQLLENYQAEILKTQPDPVLAGTYLGLSTTQRVTESLVEELNGILCVTTSPKIVGRIVRSARKVK